MRTYSWLLSFILILFMTACGPAAPEQTNPEVNDGSTNVIPTTTVEITLPVVESGAVNPTHTPPPLPDAYPAPPTPAPTPEGYPAKPTAAPTVNPYPGAYPAPEGFVWMLRPVGEQCADAEPDYADLQDAIASLTAAGLTVGDAEMAELIVCAACGCPTSAHFRIQIDANDVTAAESLGWSQE